MKTKGTTIQKKSSKRYAADIDLYIYAKNDEEAKTMLNRICRFLKKQDDNHAKGKSLVEMPFGSMNPREVAL